MSAFETELRACLGEVLGEEPPVPDTEALLFFKQWLAERNLGLVPIAEPAAFEWPGHWLARVRTTEGDHAVLMFGAPSGALFDPAGAIVRRRNDRSGVAGRAARSATWRRTARPQTVPARSPGCSSLRRPRRRSSPSSRSSRSRAAGLDGDRYAARPRDVQRAGSRLPADARRSRDAGRAERLVGARAAKRRHPRRLAQPAGRPAFPDRRGRVHRTPPVRAVRPSGEGLRGRPPPPARPPRRLARGHPGRRHDRARRRARSARLIAPC